MGGVPARITVVTLGARDLDAQKRFYSSLGWTMAVDLDDFACFETAGAVLCLFRLDRLADDGRVEPAESGAGMRGFSLAINVDRVEQVDEVIEAARQAGARITKDPVDATDFDGRSAYFADPEENYWEVACVPADSKVGTAIRRATGG